MHGGAWRSRYDRVHASPLADFLARRGFAVANVEYRRGGDDIPQQRGGGGGPVPAGADPVAGRWPETFDDVAAALDAMPVLAARELPGADVRRIVVTGHSAGGHLALWAAARHVLPEGSPWRLPAPPPLTPPAGPPPRSPRSGPGRRPRSRTSRRRSGWGCAAARSPSSWAGRPTSRTGRRTPIPGCCCRPGSPPRSCRESTTSSSRRPSPRRTSTRRPWPGRRSG
ncbi:alpha/beta hydrolase [Streptomyces sp. MBT55]|uniref:alpha/beta hydrolase n=1 Tax=Streptomyces sp. MBT55 TaxID=1488386 RepID=UPI0035AB8D32